MADRLSGQGGQILVAGIAAFGVTKCDVKRTYVNADTTVTSSGGWEEFVPIVRGVTYDVTVPFDNAQAPQVDKIFDGLFANGLAAPIACTYTLPLGNHLYSGSGMLESYTVTDDAKDACRVAFVIKMTGAVTVT